MSGFETVSRKSRPAPWSWTASSIERKHVRASTRRARRPATLPAISAKYRPSSWKPTRAKGYPNNALHRRGRASSTRWRISSPPTLSIVRAAREVEINTRGKVVRELDYTRADGRQFRSADHRRGSAEGHDAMRWSSTIDDIRTEQEDTRWAATCWQRRSMLMFSSSYEENKCGDLAGGIRRDGRHGSQFRQGAGHGQLSGLRPVHVQRRSGEHRHCGHELAGCSTTRCTTAPSPRSDTPGSIFKLVHRAGRALSEGAITLDGNHLPTWAPLPRPTPHNPAKCWIDKDSRYKHAEPDGHRGA